MTSPTAARSLIIGANGQVGRRLLAAAGAEQCIPAARNPPSPDWLTLDLANIERDGVLRMLERYSLDAIYCVGGMTNVELCETEEDLAMHTNFTGPAVLAAVARELQVPFVYFSTEYIFDGASGPYTEEAKANPISVYGRSKWLGEQAVREAYDRSLVLRTTVVYGPDEAKKNFLYGLRRILLAGETMRVPEDQISTPTYNLDLAQATLELVKSQASGCYHICGPELFSRLDFAKAAANFWDLDTRLISGVPTSMLGQRAPRPLNAGLLTDKLRNQHPEIHMRTFAEALSHWQEVDFPPAS